MATSARVECGTGIAQGGDIASQLKRIALANNGLLLPQEVVAAARPVESILHDQFTWDDNEAAERYRLWEARHLIRVHVQVEAADERDIETRVFVSLATDRANGGGYRLTTAVMSDEGFRQQLLADALRELQTFQQKYSRLKELASVIRPVKRLLQQQQMAQ